MNYKLFHCIYTYLKNCYIQKEQLKKEKRFQVIEEKRKRGVKGSPPFLVVRDNST